MTEDQRLVQMRNQLEAHRANEAKVREANDFMIQEFSKAFRTILESKLMPALVMVEATLRATGFSNVAVKNLGFSHDECSASISGTWPITGRKTEVVMFAMADTHANPEWRVISFRVNGNQVQAKFATQEEDDLLAKRITSFFVA